MKRVISSVDRKTLSSLQGISYDELIAKIDSQTNNLEDISNEFQSYVESNAHKVEQYFTSYVRGKFEEAGLDQYKDNVSVKCYLTAGIVAHKGSGTSYRSFLHSAGRYKNIIRVYIEYSSPSGWFDFNVEGNWVAGQFKNKVYAKWSGQKTDRIKEIDGNELRLCQQVYHDIQEMGKEGFTDVLNTYMPDALGLQAELRDTEKDNEVSRKKLFWSWCKINDVVLCDGYGLFCVKNVRASGRANVQQFHVIVDIDDKGNYFVSDVYLRDYVFSVRPEKYLYNAVGRVLDLSIVNLSESLLSRVSKVPSKWVISDASISLEFSDVTVDIDSH